MTTDSPYNPQQDGAPKLTHAQVKQHYAASKARMIRKLLALGYQMNYHLPKTQAERRMRGWEVCKLHVNRWLLSEHSAVRMEMDEMTHKQLTVVITQFERVYRDYLKRL